MTELLVDGQPANRAAVNAALAALEAQGNAILSSISAAYTDSLAQLQRSLDGVNSRRVRANALPDPGTLGKLEITDFTRIDQSNTTCTVRPDSGRATLREKITPQNITVQTSQFTASTGTVSSFGELYQVVTTGSTLPVGTFRIALAAPVQGSLLLLDVPAFPANPVLSIQVSQDGTTYVDATSVSLNGYRIAAQIPSGAVQYIQVAISPSQPDDMSGNTFTFGITDMQLALVQFQLASQLSSRSILINPVSSQFRFVADADPGVLFYLSVAGSAFSEVNSGDLVAIPGTLDTLVPGVTIGAHTVGVLSQAVANSYYPNSVIVTDSITGVPYPILHGLDPSNAAIPNFLGKYISLFNGTLTLIPQSGGDSSKTCQVAYSTGPSPVSVQLRVLISTSDNSTSPVFRGATFQEI